MSQYGENPYYSNTNGGGGGFMPNSGSPYGSASGSPSGFNKKSEAAHSLRPLTCKQVLTATQPTTDSEWHVDDREIGQITIVAQVITVNKQATNSVYNLEDGTARVECRSWTSGGGEEEGDKDGITERAYVRVTGAIKNFGSRRYVNSTHIRPCTDPHELYYHMLDVMTVSCMVEKGPPGQTQNGQVSAGQTTSAGASAYTAQATTISSDQYSHLPQTEQAILHFIAGQEVRDEGINVKAIARAVGGDALAISNALDRLMDEGLVFSTIDESHFNIAA